MLKEFKEFALRGNLLELAVAFVLGLAFAAVVTSLVDDIIMQLVAAIFGKPDFSALTFSIGDAVIKYGSFLTALVTIAWVLFHLSVRSGRAIAAALASGRSARRGLPASPS